VGGSYDSSKAAGGSEGAVGKGAGAIRLSDGSGMEVPELAVQRGWGGGGDS